MLLWLLLLLFSTHAVAQQFQVGLATGGTYWMEADAIGDRTMRQHKMPAGWEHTALLRYQSKQWLSLEAGVSYSKMNLMPFEWRCINCYTSAARSDQLVTFSLNLQSRFTNPQRRLSQYVGVGLLYGEHYARTTRVYTLVQYNTTQQYAGVGFHHLMAYPLFPGWTLSLKTGFHAVLGNSILTFEQGTLLLGASVRLLYAL